jgi:hypothetical protein
MTGDLTLNYNAASLTIQSANSTAATLVLKDSGTTNSLIIGSAGQSLYFQTGGSERMRIDSTGNVGIGQSPTGGRLQITGNSTSSYLSVTDGTSTFLAGISGPLTGGATTGGSAIRTESFLAFLSSGGTERMRMDASGNFYLGTTTTGPRLAIDSGTNGLLANWNSTNANGGYERFQVSGVSIADLGTGAQIVSSGYTASDFGINVRTGSLVLSTAQTSRIKITNGGNVLIGTTTDAGYRVDISGDIRASNSVFSSSVDTTSYTQRLMYNGTPTWGILNGSIDEYAEAGGSPILGDGMQSDLFAFTPPTTAEFWNGSAWSGTTVLPQVFIGKLSMNYGSTYTMSPSNTKLRFTWNALGYKFWDSIIAAASTNGNTITYMIEGSTNGTTWTTIAGPSSTMSVWPGYCMWKVSGNNSASNPYFRLTIERSSTNANNIDIGQICMYGAYGGTTRLFDWDYQRNLTMYGTVNAPAFNATSTIRVKEDVENLSVNYLDKFSRLKPREYNRKDTKKHEFGFVAEEMAEVYPEVVGVDENGTPSGIDYGKLSTILTAKVQEQQSVIDKLQEQMAKVMELVKGLK